MAHIEIDRFVSKFKHLWSLGLDASIKVETHAGQAWVNLQVGLGCPPHSQQYHLPQQHGRPRHHHVGPSQYRRRERRAAVREKTFAGNQEDSVGEEAADLVAEEVIDAADAPERIAPLPSVAEEAEEVNEAAAEVVTKESDDVKAEYSCELCDFKVKSLRAFRTHTANKHANIPQVDGVVDESLEVANTFTFVSEYHEEDILYTVEEVIPKEVKAHLTSRVRYGGLRSADHLCTLLVKLPPDRKTFNWPKMTPLQVEVLKNLDLSPA